MYQQPRTGINRKPIVFAQIVKQSTSPTATNVAATNKGAQIIYSDKVVDISSNLFLHLFYQKPLSYTQGFNFFEDLDLRFKIKEHPRDKLIENKLLPSKTPRYNTNTGEIVNLNDDRLPAPAARAPGKYDIGNMRSNVLTEKDILTLSEKKSWNFKPTERIPEIYAQKLNLPIECWSACSRIKLNRELEKANGIYRAPECGFSQESCAMTPRELAMALQEGNCDDFQKALEEQPITIIHLLYIHIKCER